MKILKYVVISIILVLAITAAGFLYIWSHKGGAPFKIPKIIPDLKIAEVHLTRSVAGRTEWELKATSADYFREEGVTRLESPEVTVYGNGDKRIELRGDEGKVFNNTNDVALSGNVNIVTSDGYIFQSDSLRYSSGKKVVTTESKVFIKGKRMEAEGVGMVADIGRDRVFVKKGVKAVLEGTLK
ncbi:MAG: LPS export ABC transporter periplasmic protein LptC [Deltaproteobacteria bacterium]|nr:LPS export ABC transporter periplasmic protein LptC [Deltaproteobacteria bacterium]